MAPNVQKVIVGKLNNNLYLVTGERAVFIDSSPGTDEQVNALLELWEGAGRPETAAIMLTHWHYDHTGGARKLAEATKGVIMSSSQDRALIEKTMPGTQIGRTVADGETLDLGVHLESLRKLQTYDTGLIGPGHGPEVDEPRAFFEEELATLAQEHAQ